MKEGWKQWEGYVIDGRFTLRDFQGGSDHSAVFLTEYGQYAQRAAIKFIEANPATASSQLWRWERAAKVSHRHLIRLHQWGQCQLGSASMLYVVSDFAEENLAQILPNRALSPAETEFMLRSVLEVLAHIHNEGLAHGRLKPTNIMAVGDDLKLASDTLCAPGEKALSPREPTVYDPPELSTSGPSSAGDVWSLGVTLVEALTQRTSPGHAMRQGDPAIPETIPAPFLEIARQSLRMDPERRWTVPEIAARLLPVHAVPAKSGMRPGYIVASLIVLLLGAVLVGPRLVRRSPEASSPKPPEHPPAIEAPTGGSAGVRTPSQAAEGVKAEVPHSASAPPTTSSNTASPNSTPPDEPRTPKSDRSNQSKTAGEVASQVLPTVSQRSLNTITGKVRVGVRLSVDATGHVVSASLQSPGPSRYFAKVAQEASRRWKFTPPQVNGQATRSEWMLNFAFARKGVEVQPKQLSP